VKGMLQCLWRHVRNGRAELIDYKVREGGS
jgi:hypothetical protein